MSIAEVIPYVGIISLAIAVIGLGYNYGKKQQKSEHDKQEIIRKLDEISAKIDRVPKEFLPLFIDLYKMWEQTSENPRINKKRKPTND